MKIVMLTDSMHIGGAETHVFELSRLLASLGHRVTVLSAGGATADRLAAVGVNHKFLPDALSGVALHKLAEAIREERPHAVHVHTRRRAFLCRMLLPTLHFPMVFTAHAMLSPRFPRGRMSYFPREIIAVSEDIGIHLRDAFGISEERITVIENGVDTERFCPSPMPDGVFTVLSVSRQDKDSAHAATLLCELAPRLRERIGKIRIVIVGGGNALPDLRAAARRANEACGREVVTLLGAVTDTAPLYGACHVFVGVSRAAMEAMATARPVILCGNEGYLGILDESTLPAAAATNLCARGEERATAERLFEHLVSLAESPRERWEALGTFGRETICERYGAEQMARKTLAVYERVYMQYRADKSTDAIICGYYGHGNCGDEMIMRQIVKTQRERDAEARLGIMTARGIAPDGAVGIHRYRPDEVARALRNSGSLILGGGSLLQDTTSRRSLLYYLSLIRAARRMGLPVMLYANGIGPLSPRGERLCREVLCGVDVISLRDGDSLETVKNMKLPHTRVLLGADPVLVERGGEEQPVKFPRITFFPKGGQKAKDADILPKSIAEIAKIMEYNVAIAAMNPNEDGGAVRRSAAIMRSLLADTRLTVTETSSDPDAILRLIRRSSLVVGERLHALILAFREGVPAVGIDRDPKIGAFLREIGKEPCFCRSVSPQDLLSCSKYAIESPQNDKIAENLSLRAQSDADLASSLISGWKNGVFW